MSSWARRAAACTAVAVLSALALASGFPGATPFDSWSPILVPLAFVPLFFFVLAPAQSPRSFLLRYLVSTWTFGCVFSLLAFRWIMVPAISFGGLSSSWGAVVLGFYAALAPVYFLILFSPLLFLAPSSCRRCLKSQWLDAVCVTLLVGTLETLAPRFFQWTIGMLLHRSDALSQTAALFGASTGSLFVVLTGIVGARAAFEFLKKPRAPQWILIRRLLPLGAVWGALLAAGYARLSANDVGRGPSIRVAYIQPNLDFHDLGADGVQGARVRLGFSDFLQMSRNAIVRHGPVDLLVWPESVFPEVLQHAIADRSGKLDELRTLSATSGVPVLVQATQSDANTSGVRTDSSVSFLIEGEKRGEQVFTKWTPMPFGESIPFEGVFPVLGDFVRSRVGNISKIERGNDPAAFELPSGARVAPLICFDAIEPRIARFQVLQSDASFFVNQANFAWMKTSNAALEFAIITKFRAIETGRSFLLSANSGPTLAWDTVGRAVIQPTGLMTMGVGAINLPIGKDQTPFIIWGNLPLQLFGAIGMLWLGARKVQTIVGAAARGERSHSVTTSTSGNPSA